MTAVPATADIDFGRTVLLCSKPLQVLNCASIVRHYRIADSRLHVMTGAIDDVDGFRSFVADSGYPQLFASISWNSARDEAIADLVQRPYDSLFIEDDRLTSYLSILPHRTERLAVFEEGTGTYRSDRRLWPRGLRRVKWRAIAAATGCGWEFGGGRKTDDVMVSRPDVYGRLNPRQAHKARWFPGLIDELQHESAAWRGAVLAACNRPPDRLGRVALVLATWGGTSDEVLATAAADADTVFYKAHPHDGAAAEGPGVAQVDATWIPAEAIVETLAAISEHLTVYHYSSSVAFYTSGLHDNVDLVDLVDARHLREVFGALDN